MFKSLFYLPIICFFLCTTVYHNGTAHSKPWEKSELLFEDSGTVTWQDKWMLDGQRSKVINTKQGMELIAGTEHGNDSCHAVLCTKKSFEGNICIEFDYTRTDTATRCVNILYFHASGRGDAEYRADIELWNDKRVVPIMGTYFNNINAYQISYAAFAANEFSGDDDYIRLRRYNPDKKGLKGTDVSPDHFETRLFTTGKTYHIMVFRYNNQIEMHVQNNLHSEESLVCTWDVSMFPLYQSGRIGLRHMYTRSSRYKNFNDYQKVMEKVNGTCELCFYEGQGHGFFNYRNFEYYKKTVAETDKFLQSIGFLNKEPIIEAELE